jgi:hypothetical protein
MTLRSGDPGARLALGLGILWATGRHVSRDAVGPRERRAFHRVNGLPDALGGPAWLVMQAGTIGAVPVAAGVAAISGRRDVAGRLLASGAGTWLLAKAVKRGTQVSRRPSPARRGRPCPRAVGPRPPPRCRWWA